MELQDIKVLQHLRLCTEDGVKHEAVNVTKELIDDLKQQRQNSTWYAETVWAQMTYLPKEAGEPSDDQESKEVEKENPVSKPSEEGSARTFGADCVALLERQIEDLKVVCSDPQSFDGQPTCAAIRVSPHLPFARPDRLGLKDEPRTIREAICPRFPSNSRDHPAEGARSAANWP